MGMAMAIPLTLLRQIQSSSARDAWKALFDYAWAICSAALSPENVKSEVPKRDQNLTAVDLFIATAGVDLWRDYESSVSLTSDTLASWWMNQNGGRAVLVLDGLSLREVPWLLQEAKSRGYQIHRIEVTGAEIPADTTSFAKALGFSQRSALENNSAGKSHRLDGAKTDSVNLPWLECVELIGSEPRFVLWHHWPDVRIHGLSEPGQGLITLAKEAASLLTDDNFWKLIQRLTTGRRLVITSDHGYAATGLFPDASDPSQTKYLKEHFKGGRYTSDGDSGSWLPPIDLVLQSRHGRNRFVLGRRKWKISSGYPTLTHGGLSLLEVAVPFIEISQSKTIS
jgi:hypothetical protein